MRIPRVHLPGPLSDGGTIKVADKTLHYLTRVLRLDNDSPLIVFNGQSGEYDGVLVNVSKKQAEIRVSTFRPDDRESPLHIVLAQGLAKGEKMDWIVQKATELGVSEIVPLFTRYSDVKLNDERAERRQHHWQEIAISACEQCGRNRLPMIHAPIALDVWMSELPPRAEAEQRLILNLAAESHISNTVPHRAIVLVGPEGGFREDEITQAGMMGFSSWHLGPRILRAETAAVSAVSLLQARWGDLR